MAGKPIAEMSDAEIDALSPEDLLELQNGSVPDGDGDGDGDGGETDEAREQREADEAAAAAANAGGGDGTGGDEETEAERLQRLADEEEEGGEDGNRGEMIPRGRFNDKSEEARVWKDVAIEALRGQPRATEQPLQEEAPAPARPAYDFKVANREYHKLLTEGEDDKAAAKLDEIEDAREAVQKFDLEQTRISARAEAVTEMTQRQEAKAIDTVTKDLYKAYPFLNNKGKAPDEAAILAVNAKAHALIKSGKSASEAIKEAGESIGSRFAKLNDVKVPADKTPEGKTPAKVDEPRTREAVRRGLEVRQPGTGKSGVGNREQIAKLSIMDMTDAQIDALEKSDPAALAELRGDNRIPT